MENTTETKLKPMSITELKSNLSAADYEQMRRLVVMQCNVTNAAWSTWILGKNLPGNKYRDIINEIAARFGIVVFNMEGAEK